MAALRTLLSLVFIGASAIGMSARAQAPVTPTTALAPTATNTFWLPGGRSYLGLNVRSTGAASCDSIQLVCDPTRPTQLYAGTVLTDTWRVELGYLNFGRVPHLGTDARARGLNLSVVGRARLGQSLGVFGKVGTTYGRTDTAVMGAAGADPGFGLSWGGGVSYDITPRLSATLEMDSHDLRLRGSSRDPLRSTSLGLQYRY